MNTENVTVVLNHPHADKLYQLLDTHLGIGNVGPAYLYDCLNQLCTQYLAEIDITAVDEYASHGFIQSLLQDGVFRQQISRCFSYLIAYIHEQVPENADILDICFPSIAGMVIVQYVLYVNEV